MSNPYISRSGGGGQATVLYMEPPQDRKVKKPCEDCHFINELDPHLWQLKTKKCQCSYCENCGAELWPDQPKPELRPMDSDHREVFNIIFNTKGSITAAQIIEAIREDRNQRGDRNNPPPNPRTIQRMCGGVLQDYGIRTTRNRRGYEYREDCDLSIT